MSPRFGPKAGRDLEADLESEFAQRMRSIGAYYKKLHGSMYQSGLPDRYVAHRRWSGWLEMKAAANVLSPRQKRNCDRMVEAKVPVFVMALREGQRVVEDIEHRNLYVFGRRLPGGIETLDVLASLSEGCYPMARALGAGE